MDGAKSRCIVPASERALLTSQSGAKMSVLCAQKRSSDFALSTLQLEHERMIKQLRMEKMELEAEKNKLMTDCGLLKTKADLLEKQSDAERIRMHETEKEMNERLTKTVKACNESESHLILELEELRTESIEIRRHCRELEKIKADDDVKITELSALLSARSTRLDELEAYVAEKKKELSEYAELKSFVQELQAQKKDLEARLEFEEKRLPLTERVHSHLKGTGFLAKLELEHDRLKSAYKSLSKERADWLITKEENSDLRSQVQQLKVWRERALNAENALAEKRDLALNFSGIGSPSRLQRLERENQLLLAEQGELRTKAAELRSQLEETNAKLQCLTAQRTKSSDVTPYQWDLPQLLETPIQKATENTDLAQREMMLELRHRVTELEKQLDETVSSKQALEEKLEILEAKGAYDPRTTTVLTLKANPMSVLKESQSNEIVHLRHENERFRQRIKVLEDCLSRLREAKNHPTNPLFATEPTTGLSGITMVVNERLQEHPDPLSELAEVREQLRVERLRNDRLMEMFNKASTKHRNACREILGYKIDLNTADEYKVRPAFASDSKEYIQLKRVEDKLEVQDTDFTRGLPNDVRSHLDTNGCIPGFFAALTMFYLQQNTMLI